MIYSIITKLGTATREVKRAKTNNTIAKSELQIALSNNIRETKRTLIDNQISNIEADEDLKLKQLKIKQEQKKGTELLFFSLIASIISAVLSVCGLNGANSLLECFVDLQSSAITCLFLFFACLNLVISYNSTHNKECYNSLYQRWNLFQIVFLITSITSNIIFLKSQNINLALSIVLAVLLDVSSVLAIENYNAKKYKNKTLATQKEQDIFSMLVKIITYKFTGKIVKRYNEIMLQENMTDVAANPNTNNTYSIQEDLQTVAIERNISKKDNSLIHTSNSKITKEEFENRLKDIAVGTVVTPKLLDMQNCRHLFYKFKDNCNLIKKINNNYVRI